MRSKEDGESEKERDRETRRRGDRFIKEWGKFNTESPSLNPTIVYTRTVHTTSNFHVDVLCIRIAHVRALTLNVT